MERERLRQSVQHYGGDRVLLELPDEDLDGALGFTTRRPDGTSVPSLAGLLLLGRESALRELVPTHEFAFQVLAQAVVRFNEFRRFPVLKALDWLETNFRPYNPEDEVQVGLFRVPVPKVDMGAFREAVANALIHRDALQAKRTLEALLEAGLVQAHGNTPRTRSYTLSAALYSELGDKAAFTRQAGFSGLQHEQMVLNFVRQNGQIKRVNVMSLCHLTDEQAKDLLRNLRDKDHLTR